jgi:hypothetical protein
MIRGLVFIGLEVVYVKLGMSSTISTKLQFAGRGVHFP